MYDNIVINKYIEHMKKIKLKHVFLLPIILTMIVSISHVIVWYSLSNEYLWSIFMSISVEIGAMVALIAATNKIKGNIWGMFFIVTFIQMIGNIFYSYKQIDENGELFKSWVELTAPIWDSIGSDSTDSISMKRWLSFLEGGLLPIISLASLHFFVKYEGTKNEVVNEPVNDVVNETEGITEGITEGVTEGVNDSVNLDDEGVLAPESVNNPTYEITKEIYEANEKLDKPLPVVETFLDESQYLSLQESNQPVIETTETISDDIRQIIDEVIPTENTKFPMDMMLEFDDNATTTTTTNDGVKRLSYVKNT